MLIKSNSKIFTKDKLSVLLYGIDNKWWENKNVTLNIYGNRISLLLDCTKGENDFKYLFNPAYGICKEFEDGSREISLFNFKKFLPYNKKTRIMHSMFVLLHELHHANTDIEDDELAEVEADKFAEKYIEENLIMVLDTLGLLNNINFTMIYNSREK